MEELLETLHGIDRSLDAGTYRPGRWSEFVRALARRPRSDRLAISDQVSQVSEKLHLRGGRGTLPLGLGIAAEVAGAAIGGLLLLSSIARTSAALALLAAITLATTLQPLVKVGAGYIFGIRYAYTYFWHIEPRFKTRYGTYLVLPRWRRVLFHLCGTVGSPAALLLVAALTAPTLPREASVCMVLFWFTAAIQILPFVAGILGLRLCGIRRLVRLTSAGLAGIEFREGFTLRSLQ